MATREEQDTRQRFGDRYAEVRTDVVRDIERAVIGGDWGANGYTTVAQADLLAERLHLEPGDAPSRSRGGTWLARPLLGGTLRLPHGVE